MQCTKILIMLALLTMAGINTIDADADDKINPNRWKGMLSDGSVIRATDLKIILNNHRQWLKGPQNKGRQLVLINADLSGANLKGAKLEKAVLDGTKLTEADFSGADLSHASLVGADLTGAELGRATMKGANFSEAKLKDAHLFRADLRNAVLRHADLRRTPMFKSNLSHADLRGADLEGAYLFEAILTEANLKEVNFIKADLREADLRGFYLARVKLQGANLQEANLSGANLMRADLSGTNLRNTNLSKAKLIGTDFKDARAEFTLFNESIFEPLSVQGMNFLGAKGFSTIIFNDSRRVDELRKMAKDSGLRNEERSLTSALHKYRLKGKPVHEKYFEFIWLGLLTDFGADPWRSLKFLGFSILIFTPLYVFSFFLRGKYGIYKICLPDPLQTELGECEPKRLYKPGVKAIGYGFYFSILSAFSMGWRDFNIGNWIVRMQWKEYALRSTGWVRTISGFQSLFSLYLLAIWLLTYFGRPFE